MSGATKDGLVTNEATLTTSGPTLNRNCYSEIKTNFEAVKVREDYYNGRKCLVVPMVMITVGVHNGSAGPLLYPPEELGKTPEVWNAKPIVDYHPQKDGQGISACSPEVLASQQVGWVFNTKYDPSLSDRELGRLPSEAWLDVERCKLVDNRILEAIEKKQMMEVSTGLFTDNEPRQGEWRGEKYVAIARNYRPDHLAILPDQRGSCSLSDGAGLMRNQEGQDWASFIGNAGAKENDEGGLTFSGPALQKAKNADLITLPQEIQGTNCGNCSFAEKLAGGSFCQHEKVQLPVTPRMCCKYWDNEGVDRNWESTQNREQLVENKVKHLPSGKWEVTSEDGSKSLGTYDTKDEAVKRLKQVEWFKAHPQNQGEQRAEAKIASKRAKNGQMDGSIEDREPGTAAPRLPNMGGARTDPRSLLMGHAKVMEEAHDGSHRDADFGGQHVQVQGDPDKVVGTLKARGFKPVGEPRGAAGSRVQTFRHPDGSEAYVTTSPSWGGAGTGKSVRVQFRRGEEKFFKQKPYETMTSPDGRVPASSVATGSPVPEGGNAQVPAMSNIGMNVSFAPDCTFPRTNTWSPEARKAALEARRAHVGALHSAAGGGSLSHEEDHSRISGLSSSHVDKLASHMQGQGWERSAKDPTSLKHPETGMKAKFKLESVQHGTSALEVSGGKPPKAPEGTKQAEKEAKTQAKKEAKEKAQGERTKAQATQALTGIGQRLARSATREIGSLNQPSRNEEGDMPASAFTHVELRDAILDVLGEKYEGQPVAVVVHNVHDGFLTFEVASRSYAQQFVVNEETEEVELVDAPMLLTRELRFSDEQGQVVGNAYLGESGDHVFAAGEWSPTQTMLALNVGGMMRGGSGVDQAADPEFDDEEAEPYVDGTVKQDALDTKKDMEEGYNFARLARQILDKGHEGTSKPGASVGEGDKPGTFKQLTQEQPKGGPGDMHNNAWSPEARKAAIDARKMHADTLKKKLGKNAEVQHDEGANAMDHESVVTHEGGKHEHAKKHLEKAGWVSKGVKDDTTDSRGVVHVDETESFHHPKHPGLRAELRSQEVHHEQGKPERWTETTFSHPEGPVENAWSEEARKSAAAARKAHASGVKKGLEEVGVKGSTLHAQESGSTDPDRPSGSHTLKVPGGGKVVDTVHQQLKKQGYKKTETPNLFEKSEGEHTHTATVSTAHGSMRVPKEHEGKLHVRFSSRKEPNVKNNKYLGFKKLEGEIAKKGGTTDPGAVAAAIGRKKYGKKKFQQAAAKGKSLKGAKPKQNRDGSSVGPLNPSQNQEVIMSFHKANAIAALISSGVFNEEDRPVMELWPDERLQFLTNSIEQRNEGESLEQAGNTTGDKTPGKKVKWKKKPVKDHSEDIEGQEEDGEEDNEGEDVTAKAGGDTYTSEKPTKQGGVTSDGLSGNADQAVEEYLAQAPPSIREVLAQGQQLLGNQRSALIKRITANKKNRFTVNALAGRSIEELQALADLATSDEPQTRRPAPLFLGMGEPGQRDVTGNAEAPLGLPTFNFEADAPKKK